MRRALALLLALLFCVPAQATSNPRLRLHYALDPNAITYFAALVSNGCTTPSGAFKTAVNNYIVAEKAAGNWGYQDFAYILATADSCTASINLAQPNLYKITWSGSCTYSAANGLNGDSATCFGDTNIGQSSLTKAKQNLSHVFLCLAGTNNNNVFGGVAATGTFKIDPGTNKTTRVSSSTQFTDTAGGGAGCHYGDRVNSSTTINTGKNGSVQSSGASNNSTAPGTTHAGLCQNNSVFCSSTSKIFFAEIGQPVASESSHYTNVRALLVALGAQGI